MWESNASRFRAMILFGLRRYVRTDGWMDGMESDSEIQQMGRRLRVDIKAFD